MSRRGGRSGTKAGARAWAVLLYLLVPATTADPPAAEAPVAGSSSASVACGGTLVGLDSGVLQTPGFPGPYPVPLRCTWVLDVSHRQEPSIALYLTQLYVLSGLTVTQYAYYERDDFHMGEQLLLTVTEQTVLSSRVVVARSPYLVIRLHGQRLEGNQLRALPHLLTVFGLNATWEARDGAPPPPPRPSCSVSACSLAGSCLASADLTTFRCHCFPGHSGADCGRGPGCEGASDPCRNGATCRHSGWQPEVRCLCRTGYTGAQCETKLQTTNADCPDNGACTDCRPPGEAQARARYTVTARLAGNSSAGGPGGLTRHQLERQAQKYLRNASSAKMEHFRLLSTGSTIGELSFQWVGPRADEARYRDLLARPAAHQGTKWLEVNHQQVTLRVDPVLRILALSTTPVSAKVLQASFLNASVEAVNLNATLAVEAVSEGESFTLTCVASGSANIKFHWLKDGMVLGENTTRTTKWLWTRVESLGGGRFQSELQVRSAVPLHAGRYTCKASDWEARVCGSLQVRVKAAPQVLVSPMASTLKTGDNLTVTCLALGDEEVLGDTPDSGVVSISGGGASRGQGEPLGFTWTRNRALLPLSPGKEVWEDLVPAGSLLRLYNVRRAATYCCQVRGRTLSRTACSDVHVVGEGQLLGVDSADSESESGPRSRSVPLCSAAETQGLWWPDTAAGAEARLPCPPQYTGRAAVRGCGLVDVGRPRWGPADFSQCESRQLAAVREQLEAVTLGLSNASAAGVLASALTLASDSMTLPGEGSALLSLLRGAAQHLAALPRPPPTASTAPVLSADAPNPAGVDAAAPPSPKASTAVTSEADQIRKLSLEGLDLLLRRPRAINSEQHVVEMQRLARSVSLLWAVSPQVVGGSGERLSLPAMAVSVASVSSAAPDQDHQHQNVKIHFPAPASRWADWTEGFVDVVLRLGPDHADVNNTQGMGLAVVAYRNLSKLLPERLIIKQENDEELEMEINSRVVSVWLGSPNGAVVTEPQEGFIAEAWLRALAAGVADGQGPPGEEGAAAGRPDWVEVCGLTSEVGASYTGAWDLNACVLERTPLAPNAHPGMGLHPGVVGGPVAHTGAPQHSNLSRCTCNRPGTIALLLVSQTAKAPAKVDASPPVVVVAGCGCCLLLSLVTLALLLLRCRPRGRHHAAVHHHQALLRLQCCAATVAAMAVFLHAAHRPPPPSCFAALATSLEALMLIGLSSHISKLLLIYTELMRVGNLNYAVVGVTTGAPVLAVLCSHLAYMSAEWPVRHWWLERGSPFFYMFVASAALLHVLFVLLACTVTRRLVALRASKLTASEEAGLASRSGLVWRASLLFVASSAMQVSSIVYVNVPHVRDVHLMGDGDLGPAGHIAFGATAGVLGLLIVVCYAVRPEPNIGVALSTASKDHDDNDGSLTFFTKQDVNAESEGGAPLDLIRESSLGHDEHLLHQGVAGGSNGTHAVWGPYHQPYSLQGVPTRVCVELIGEEASAGGIPAVMRCNMEMPMDPMIMPMAMQCPSVVTIAPMAMAPMVADNAEGSRYTTTSFVMAPPALPTPDTLPMAIAAPVVPIITVTRTDQDQVKDNDSVLNRITQDLDYLLNRTPDPGQVACPLPPAPPPPATAPPGPGASILRRRPSLGPVTIQEAVQEEDEEEEEDKGSVVVA